MSSLFVDRRGVHLELDAGALVFRESGERAAGFRRNRGLRIDLILASNALMAEVQDVVIDRNARAAERPSDHAPVLIQLEEV